MNVMSYQCSDNLFLAIHASQLHLYGNTNKINILADEPFFIQWRKIENFKEHFCGYTVVKSQMFMNLL